MRFRTWMTFLCLVVLSPNAQADYYLKFETSGVNHVHSSGALSSDSNAWMKVSIVDSYPTGQPIHFEGSDTGTVPINTAADTAVFYVADVPRSVTILEKSSGAKQTLSAGDAPLPFSNAPSFLLPHRLLVATGMQRLASYGKIYIAAAMPVKSVAHSVPTANVFGNGWAEADGGNCVEGWFEKIRDSGTCNPPGF